MTITTSSIIVFGGVLAVVVTVFKMVFTVYDFVQHNKEQDARLEQIEARQKQQSEESALILSGMHAALDGLTQQGCNHTVPETKQRLYEYINKKAHE